MNITFSKMNKEEETRRIACRVIVANDEFLVVAVCNSTSKLLRLLPHY
jgi:hypothetical protein